MLPEWTWIPIVIVGTGLAGTIGFVLVGLLHTLRKQGGSFGMGRHTFVIEGPPRPGGDKNPVLREALEYNAIYVSELRHIVFQVWARKALQNGAADAVIADYGDAKDVIKLISNFVAGGNGKPSAQKIIEADLIRGLWQRARDEHAIETHIRSQILKPIVGCMKDAINADYDSDILRNDRTREARWVSKREFVDLIEADETKDRLVQGLLPIYMYAQNCVEEGCRDGD